MGVALRPSWPPAPVEPRRPGLRSAHPARYDALILSRDLLRDMARRNVVSERDLAACWGVSPRVARQKLSGELPIHFGEVLSLPRRVKLELMAAAMVAELPAVQSQSCSHG